MENKRKPIKDQKIYAKKDENMVRLIANVPYEIFLAIKGSNMSNNKAVNEALATFFRDHYKSRLEQALFTLYEVMFDLEKLKEKGQVGFTKFSEAHALQLESYQEAIRILENSPLFLPPEDPE